MTRQYIRIDNCIKGHFEFLCPKSWSTLQETGVENVKHCSRCNNEVYLCSTDEDLQAHVIEGHCVAVDITEKVEASMAKHQAEIDDIKRIRSMSYVGYIKPPQIKKPD